MAEEKLAQQLQKSFKYIESAISAFTDTTKRSKDDLTSLSNFSEQFYSCNKVDFQQTGLRDHPQIKIRTLAKIQAILEKHMSQLWQDLSVLQSTSKQVAKHYDETVQVYNQNPDQFDLSSLVIDDVWRPSYVAMIEMLGNLDNMFHLEYMKRWQALKDVDYYKPKTIQHLCAIWTRTKDLEELVKYTLGQTQYFIQEKIEPKS